MALGRLVAGLVHGTRGLELAIDRAHADVGDAGHETRIVFVQELFGEIRGSRFEVFTYMSARERSPVVVRMSRLPGFFKKNASVFIFSRSASKRRGSTFTS